MQQTGNWTATDFLNLVLEPRSRLGAQAKLKNAKDRGHKQTIEHIYKAWDKATSNVTQSPAWTSSDLAELAQVRQQQCTRSIETSELTRAERLVVGHVQHRLAETGSIQRAISRQDFIDATGLGKTALGTAQKTLLAKGLLVLVERGTPGGPKADRRRAHVWALADAEDAETRPTPTCRPHASSTGDRYVAPQPTRGATLSGAPGRARDVAPAHGREDLPDRPLHQVLEELVRTLMQTQTREVVLLSWPPD